MSALGGACKNKQKIKHRIKYSVYLCKLIIIDSFIFENSKKMHASGFSGSNEFRYAQKCMWTKKNLSTILSSLYCNVKWNIPRDHLRKNLHRSFCDTFSCKSASHSCFPLSVLNFKLNKKRLTSLPHRFILLISIARTHCRLCDYYYYYYYNNYLRRSLSFSPPPHHAHASELILFENDIVRMLSLSVCSEQMIELTKREKKKKKNVDLRESKSNRKVETDCIRLALECWMQILWIFFLFFCFIVGFN